MSLRGIFRIPPALKGNRRYAVYWAGLLISNAGSQMQVWAIFWHLRLLSDDPIVVSFIGLIKFLPVLLFAMIGGLVADSFDRRKVVLITQSMMALALSTGARPARAALTAATAPRYCAWAICSV